MGPATLFALAGREHGADLRREARAARRDVPATSSERRERAAVTIRWAGATDIPALEELAALDGTRLPLATTLVAERDGRILAALPMVAGARPIADPFSRTGELVDLLRLRAEQLRHHTRPRPTRRLAAFLRPVARPRP
jgi:hypothetical protein